MAESSARIALLSTSDTDLLSARASGPDYGWANPNRARDPELAALVAGANLVQVYTGLVYRGPALIGECVDALRRRKEAPSSTPLPLA